MRALKASDPRWVARNPDRLWSGPSRATGRVSIIPSPTLRRMMKRSRQGGGESGSGIPSGATAARRPLRPHDHPTAAERREDKTATAEGDGGPEGARTGSPSQLLARRLTVPAVHWTASTYGYLPAFL